MRYFVAVAEELHFGRAAARLHIAQPSLSTQVRRLETQLGVTLMRRNSRRVELTEAGETLLREGRRVLAQARRVVDATRTAGADALTVGFYGSAGAGMLPSVIATFGAQHPSTPVTVRELLLGDLDDLIEGEVDVAFTRLIPEQVIDLPIEIEVLAQEPRVVALPIDHRLAGRESVVFADFAGERFVINPVVPGGTAARWEAEQRRHGLPARVGAEVASLAELLTYVAAGQGISLVPISVAGRHPREDVTYVPVLDAEPAVVSLAWPTGRRRAIDEAFAAVARAVVPVGSDHVTSAASATSA